MPAPFPTPERDKPPRPAAGSRVYAVGDIHGRLDLLQRLHHRIVTDAGRAARRRNIVIYLGDYIDRGPESAGVIELLSGDPLPGFDCVHLKGNHEEIALRFLGDSAIAPSWLHNGAIETMESYGVTPPFPPDDHAELERARQEFVCNLPPRHRAFLENLALCHAEGDYFFAHAGVRPGVPLDEQNARDLLWIREDFLMSGANFGKTVVHGHTIVPAPQRSGNRIAIDTGAYRTGHLTCLVLDDAEQRFLQT